MIYDNTQGEPVKIEGGVDKRGIAKMEVTYLAKDLDAAWSIAPMEWGNLSRTGLQLRFLAGGAYNVTGTYEGPDPSSSSTANAAVYELDFTQAQKPIQVHPAFATPKTGLKDVYKWVQLKDDNTAWGFAEECPKGITPAVGEKGAAVNPLFGVTDWLDVGAIWRKSWMSEDSDIPNVLFENLGRIDVPDGPVPAVHQGRNWLKSAAKARSRGRVWELSIEWMLSGRGGHEPALYKPY